VHDPHIVVNQGGGQSVFQNGVWSQTVPDIAIFDDSFVADNVCSGIELQTSHRQKLHELILGSQGVALSNALKGHVSRVEQHNIDLRTKGDAIPAIARGPLTINAFCNLQEDPDIDEKVQGAERRLAAAKAADAIRQRPVFLGLGLPEFDTEEINNILAASALVVKHGWLKGCHAS
jgi:wobble nucleotide-excising tRNase